MYERSEVKLCGKKRAPTFKGCSYVCECSKDANFDGHVILGDEAAELGLDQGELIVAFGHGLWLRQTGGCKFNCSSLKLGLMGQQPGWPPILDQIMQFRYVLVHRANLPTERDNSPCTSIF
jgi:hypothetical protein